MGHIACISLLFLCFWCIYHNKDISFDLFLSAIIIIIYETAAIIHDNIKI